MTVKMKIQVFWGITAPGQHSSSDLRGPRRDPSKRDDLFTQQHNITSKMLESSVELL